ncbi:MULTISPECIES: rhomboid family intramembrane serine protease [unclassified Streptomyces]|uniref:rhomboid family intramembrane serine protease n=1 Tax=unclassified Streptomyces TaxID=2593676 RepID=UPI002DDB2100|nr:MULTISPECIES: rhomboid family intramembrane serine protease [unclassified Streptomyces]WSA93607.1 rhomboid family intramembrane serine protease [Streptomyces sp. NBC_01795]WSB77978.1 rhomboid family intramembrane serine protease [Streptomyces sp. NBC_01775]WSS13767.1 rhomboid family intramembrane serine protease [Streptomyces sp. NBC_01186]WSS42591.1 rhomboid family intramembrane serine protease [Streptomyces sp. NBC_01187]
MERNGQPEDRAEQRGPAFCYRHPDRETGISCARCERPVCTDCMIPASVGYQCPECVRSGSGTGHAPDANQPRTIAGGSLTSDPRLVTKVLLGINAAVFVAVLAVGNRLLDELLLFGQAATERYGPLEGVAEGQWYRLFTSMFLHQEIWHIAMNMLGLWFLGPPLEQALGRVRFLGLYLLSGLGGGAVTYLLAAPQQASLGASGAIFGLFGATAVLMRRLRYDMRPILILLAINLVFTFTWKSIAWEAHIGGLVTGVLLAFALVHAPREHRKLVQYAAFAVLVAVVVLILVLRTLQLT